MPLSGDSVVYTREALLLPPPPKSRYVKIVVRVLGMEPGEGFQLQRVNNASQLKVSQGDTFPTRGNRRLCWDPWGRWVGCATTESHELRRHLLDGLLQGLERNSVLFPNVPFHSWRRPE